MTDALLIILGVSGLLVALLVVLGRYAYYLYDYRLTNRSLQFVPAPLPGGRL